MMEKTTLYLPSDLHRHLEEVARRRGVTQAELVREALRTFLHEQSTPTLRSLGAAHSTEITGRTARDWRRKHWRPK